MLQQYIDELFEYINKREIFYCSGTYTRKPTTEMFHRDDKQIIQVKLNQFFILLKNNNYKVELSSLIKYKLLYYSFALGNLDLIKNSFKLFSSIEEIKTNYSENNVFNYTYSIRNIIMAYDNVDILELYYQIPKSFDEDIESVQFLLSECVQANYPNLYKYFVEKLFKIMKITDFAIFSLFEEVCHNYDLFIWLFNKFKHVQIDHDYTHDTLYPLNKIDENIIDKNIDNSDIILFAISTSNELFTTKCCKYILENYDETFEYDVSILKKYENATINYTASYITICYKYFSEQNITKINGLNLLLIFAIIKKNYELIQFLLSKKTVNINYHSKLIISLIQSIRKQNEPFLETLLSIDTLLYFIVDNGFTCNIINILTDPDVISNIKTRNKDYICNKMYLLLESSFK